MPPIHTEPVRRLHTELVRRRPTLGYALAGCAAGTLTVLAGGRIGTVRVTTPLTTWFGLLTRSGYGPGASPVPGLLLMAGLITLALLWLQLVRRPHPAVRTERDVWTIGGAWALPFVLGPPLLSSDVYSYAAQGLLVGRGLDPYSVGPSALGPGSALAAVDPSWRSVPSPYGPLATWFQHFSVVAGGGTPLGAVIVMRLAAVAAVVAIGLLAADLAGARRVPVLALTVLNPLVLLQVISAEHLEGVFCALLLGALVARRHGNHALAVVLACAAAAIKAPGLVAVLALIAWQRPGRSMWTDGLRDAAVAVVACVGLTMLVPHGWGWIPALNTPALGYTPAAPASLIGDLFKPIVRPASFDDLTMAGRTAALLAAGCVVAYLTATAQRRALERTVGFGLIAVALLSPVIYPWYLLWGVVCLAPVAQGRLRAMLILLCASGTVMAAPGLPRATADIIDVVVAVGALMIVASSDVRFARLTRVLIAR
jgi:hypothetical protein